jgi:hypothetical protein
MNKTYILLAAFAVSLGVSFASGPGSKTTESKLPPKQCSEVLEPLENNSDDEKYPSRWEEIKPFLTEKSSCLKEEERPEETQEINLHTKTVDMKEEEETSRKSSIRHGDAERAAQNGFTRFTRHVREALPSAVFSAVMGVLTFNEINDRHGTNASIIPLSSMAILGGIQAVQILRSGQSGVCNMVPRTVREMVSTGFSLVPGVAYSAYHHFNDNSTHTISNATKQCVKQCLERQ